MSKNINKQNEPFDGKPHPKTDTNDETKQQTNTINRVKTKNKVSGP